VRRSLGGLLTDAIAEGHLPGDADVDQVVSQLEGIYLAHHLANRLADDPNASDRARRALEALLAPDTIRRKNHQ
jgi:hypothetical protein